MEGGRWELRGREVSVKEIHVMGNTLERMWLKYFFFHIFYIPLLQMKDLPTVFLFF